METRNQLDALLAALPHLSSLLFMAEHVLIARMVEMIDEDIEAPFEEDPPNLSLLDEEYPDLFKFVTEGPWLNKPRPSQLCQFAADLYQLAAEHFWHENA